MAAVATWPFVLARVLIAVGVWGRGDRVRDLRKVKHLWCSGGMEAVFYMQGSLMKPIVLGTGKDPSFLQIISRVTLVNASHS